MTFRLQRPLVTRPLPSAESLVQGLVSLDLHPILCPLTTFVSREPDLFPTNPLAFIATSSFAIDRLSALSADRHIPLYVLGSVSAKRAQIHGFKKIHMAPHPQASSLKELVYREFRNHSGTLLYVTGRHITDPLVFPPETFKPHLHRLIVYEAQEVPHLSPEALLSFHQGEVSPILLFSGRAAHLFFSLAQQAHVDTSSLSYLCLSPKIKSICQGYGAFSLLASDTPTQEGMMEILKTLITHERRDSKL